jgi:hypothetical protein
LESAKKKRPRQIFWTLASVQYRDSNFESLYQRADLQNRCAWDFLPFFPFFVPPRDCTECPRVESFYCLSNGLDGGLAKHIQFIRGIPGLAISKAGISRRVPSKSKSAYTQTWRQPPATFRMDQPSGAHSCSHPDPRFERAAARALTVVGRSSHNTADCVLVVRLGAAGSAKS